MCHGIPTVKLTQGSLQGYHKKSYDGRIYTAFEGIPYAVPPVGPLRFKVIICWLIFQTTSEDI